MINFKNSKKIGFFLCTAISALCAGIHGLSDSV